ncbi:MAG: response regulator [Planctomycetota bacterium]|jgi:two-component system chemotaxis response regulator CheY
MALNVLIVDDSSLTRKRIKRIIEMANLDVGQFLEAGNGVEALKVLDEASVDLVLADLNMPEMGGAEMVRRMKSSEATKSIPVVVVSTESRTTRIKDLLAEGVKDYLHKPFTPEEFREIMQTLWSKQTIEFSDVLTKALSQALETMAFLTVVPMEDDLAIPEKTVLAEISFTGAKTGTIQILAGWNFCEILAENIGALSEADDKACGDALKELANVTCGLFLPMVVSSTADAFDITVPTIKIYDNSSRWHEFVADQNSCVLNIEGYMVATKLVIEDK